MRLALVLLALSCGGCGHKEPPRHEMIVVRLDLAMPIAIPFDTDSTSTVWIKTTGDSTRALHTLRVTRFVEDR